MATGTFLDNLSDWNAKSAVVIKDLALAGEFETASLLMSLRSVANDETLSNEVRLNALTALINRAELLDVALPPYYPLSFTYPSAEKYVGLHNDLSGLNTGNYWHLTYQEYLDVLNKPSFSDFTFANLTGDPYDNGNLEADLNSKEDLIASGSNGQFFAWDKTMRFVDWANLSNKPTTLAGLGISVGDTLFNSKYLQTSSVLTSYVVGANQIVNNTDTLIGAIGKLQGQINSITTGGGSISTVGLAMPNIFTVGNSPLTGAGGTINVTLQNQLAKRFFASPTSSTGTPTFREIVAADLPTSGISAGTYGNTTNWPLITVDAYGRVTNVTLQAATSGGTVTSVSLSAPAGFSVSGSPVTTTGTLGFSWTNQTAAYVLAGPISGAAAAPSFRALVATDIPTIEISQVNTLQATLDALSDGSLGVLATDAVYIGNGSDAAVASVVSGDLAGAYLNDAGTNRAVFTIENQAVTFSKFQNITSGKLLGRYTATTGSMQEISLDPLAFTLNASTGVLGLATPNPALLTAPGDLLTSDGTTQVKLSVGANATFLIADSAQTKGIKWAALSGDATIAVSGALTIAAGAVTLGKMANANAFSIIGNDTASTSSAPKYLTKTEATTLINTFDATADLPGLVPNGSGNDATKFLSGAGTWLTVSGGAGTTTNAVTFNNTGGAAPGTTFNGSVARTIDYSTVGAPSVSGSGATGTWPIAISGNAATVTNGVYTSSTYNDPSWIGSLAGSKISGSISGSAGSVANSLFIGSGLSGSTFNGSAAVTISLNMASANTFTALQTFEGQIAVGKLTAAGNIKLFGSSSGFVSLQAPASPDSTTYTLPSTIGSAGQYLKLSTTGGTLVWDTPGGLSGTATQYAVLVGGAGNTIASLGAGTTTGQLLQYNSGSNNPSWTSVVYPASTTQNRILYSSSNNTIGEITAPSDGTFLRYTTAGGYSWSAAVTSFSVGTQGLISNSGTATAPVLAVTGNQGGIVYFTGANTWASSPALDQYELVMGGGTGAPTTINTGANNTLLISNGIGNAPSWTAATYPSTTQVNRILFSSSNDVVDQIAAPTTVDTFLKWNGSTFTWAAAGGGGGGGTTTNSLTINNSGAGNSSGITFNGSASVTISSNTVLPSFTGNAGYALVVNGTSDNVQWSPVGNVTGAGNAGRVAYWDSGSSITGSADFFWDNSNKYLGIGTTTPECGLHVTTTGSQNIKGIMNMHFDNTASAQAKYIGARARGNNPNNPSALQTDDAITSLSGRGYKATTWSNTVGGYYVYAAENWTDAATGTYLTFRGVVSGGTTVSEWARLTSSSTLVELALGQSSTKSGGLLLYSSGGAFTTRLQASPSASSSETYILPATDGTSGQLLSTDGNGVMSWITGIGSGDVVGPSSATDGDFVVFDGTTGKLIKEPLGASLAGGTITLGTSGTQGSLVINDGTTAFATTIRTATNATASASYILPTAIGSNTNVLAIQNAATGQLAWSATGTGDITRAGTNQVVTGNITFSQSALIFRNTDATRTATMSLLATTGSVANYTVTLQQASGTIALLDAAQSWSGAQTFQANVTLGTGSYNATLLDFTGTTSNRIQFAAGPVSTPNIGATAPVGTRITVANTRTNLLADFTIGMASSTEMYLGSSGSTTAISNTEISFYNKLNKSGAFVAGGLNLSSTVQSAPGTLEGTISPQLNIAAGATNWYSSGNALSYIRFWTSVSAAPTDGNARSTGTRIVLQPNTNNSWADAAIGYNDADKETWITGAKTAGSSDGRISFYSGGVTANTTFRRVGYFGGTGLIFDSPGNVNFAPITFNGTTINWINFGTIGTGAPSIGNTRSAGLRIALYPNVNNGWTDYGIGVDTANYETWISGGVTGANGGMVSFWVGASSNFKRTVWITENALNLAASTNIITNSTSINVVNTTATTVNFAGAATTLAIGNTATAAQTVNMFTASTGASTYNFATGATATATTKTINIGTGGAAGSTTNITLGTSTTTNLRFFGSANTSGKPTVTGSRGGNAALASFLTALSNLGLITDSTTA